MSNFESPVHVAVVGAGISGIAAAYHLKKLNYNVDLYDENRNPGGRIASDFLDDKAIDFGGKNIGKKYTLFRDFVSTLGGFGYEYFGINTSQIRNGKTYLLNSQNRLRSVLNLLKLMGIRDGLKISKLARQVYRSENDGFLGGDYFEKMSRCCDHQSIAGFFSAKTAKSFLRPITVRMNGAEPDQYYLGNFGTNLRLIIDQFDQIQSGMSDVFSKFLRMDGVQLNACHTVKKLLTRNGRVAGIVVEAQGREHTRLYDAVILSVPAHAASKIVYSSSKILSQSLAEVNYNPVAVVVAHYRDNVFNSSQRAIVFDENCYISNAGAYGINDLDWVRYTFSGEKAQKLLKNLNDENDLLRLAEEHLSDAVKKPLKSMRLSYRSKIMPVGLCSYGSFYGGKLGRIDNQAMQLGGLHLAGDYMKGVSIEACFRSGKSAAEQLDRYLSNHKIQHRRVS